MEGSVAAHLFQQFDRFGAHQRNPAVRTATPGHVQQMESVVRAKSAAEPDAEAVGGVHTKNGEVNADRVADVVIPNNTEKAKHSGTNQQNIQMTQAPLVGQHMMKLSGENGGVKAQSPNLDENGENSQNFQADAEQDYKKPLAQVLG